LLKGERLENWYELCVADKSKEFLSIENMRKSLVLLALVGVPLLVSCTITGAYATNDWVKSEKLPTVRHTATNPGSVKICGDHKCGPFEDMKKALQDKLKKIKSVQVNQQETKNPFQNKAK